MILTNWILSWWTFEDIANTFWQAKGYFLPTNATSKQATTCKGENEWIINIKYLKSINLAHWDFCACVCVLLCCTHSTTRRPSELKAWSGTWLMWLSARVMACRAVSSLSAAAGTSARELSSSHRWRSERRPEKHPAGTTEMWLASRRLEKCQN